jgi:hypothetical protein
MEPTFVMLVLLPLGLGLLAFIEPCSIGSSLVLIKYLEAKAARTKLLQVGVFAATRAVFIGLMGHAPMKPQPVQTVRGPKAGRGTWSPYRSTFNDTERWQVGHEIASARTPLARMFPKVIGGPV